MLRLLRLAILVVMTFMALSFVVAIRRPESGPVEKVVLAAFVLGLFFAAGRVRRTGSQPL